MTKKGLERNLGTTGEWSPSDTPCTNLQRYIPTYSMQRSAWATPRKSNMGKKMLEKADLADWAPISSTLGEERRLVIQKTI